MMERQRYEHVVFPAGRLRTPEWNKTEGPSFSLTVTADELKLSPSEINGQLAAA